MATLEVKLKQVQIPQNGSNDKGVPALLTTTLVYPRPGFPAITALRDLGYISDGFSVDFTADNPETHRPFLWSDLVLFKEELVGKAYLAAVVGIGPSKTAKFLNKLVKGLFGAAAGTLASPYAAVAAESLIGELFGSDDKGAKDNSTPIAAGGIVLDPANIASPIQIPLRAPATIMQQGAVMEMGEIKTTTFQVLKKDEANGLLELFVEPI